MKIGVAGAGAVGGYFGGMLDLAGHEVIYLARGDHLNKMKRSGLDIETPRERLTVKGIFTDEIHLFKDVELVLFCVKSVDTWETAQQLKRILSDSASILIMQNGVDNEEVLKKIFGKGRILSAATYIAASVSEPGMVTQSGKPRLAIGSLSENDECKAESIVDMFNQAGVRAWFSKDILLTKWKKLLWNVTFNPLSAITEATVGEILENSLLKKTARNVAKEACLVAKAKSISLEEKFIDEIFQNSERARHHKTSMLQDRIKGKKMEVESLCGYLVKEGERENVKTPVLQSLYGILTFMDQRNM